MDINNILSNFISIGAQIRYNLIKSEHQFEKKQLEILNEKFSFLGEEIPNIIFREKNLYPEVAIKAEINYDLTNKQLCDKIFDFSLELKEWAAENDLYEVKDHSEKMSVMANQILLKINLEYLN